MSDTRDTINTQDSEYNSVMLCNLGNTENYYGFLVKVSEQEIKDGFSKPLDTTDPDEIKEIVNEKREEFISKGYHVDECETATYDEWKDKLTQYIG